MAEFWVPMFKVVNARKDEAGIQTCCECEQLLKGAYYVLFNPGSGEEPCFGPDCAVKLTNTTRGEMDRYIASGRFEVEFGEKLRYYRGETKEEK